MSSLLKYLRGLGSGKAVLFIGMVIAMSYVNALGVNFIWDDYAAVVSNPTVKSGGLKDIVGPLYRDEGQSILKTPRYSRPLQILTYAWDYHIWRLNPFGYHLTNILLHCANAVLLYFLLMMLLRDGAYAFMASLLFGVNPLFTSSVTYISGRADLLLVFFTLSTVLLFIKARSRPAVHVAYYLLSVVSFYLALLSKEIGLMCLVILFACDRLVCRSDARKAGIALYAPYIALLVLWCYLKPYATPGFIGGPLVLREIPLALATLLKGMVVYTFLSILPFDLRMGRTMSGIAGLQDPWSYVSCLFFLALTVFLARRWRKNKVLLLGVVWFYVPLFVQLLFNCIFAKRGNEILLPEHNLYFSYGGLLIALLSVLIVYRPPRKVRRLGLLVVVPLFVYYCGKTIAENFIWQDEVRLFEKNIRLDRNSHFNFISYANLGFAYERAEEYALAEKNFALAAETAGGDPYFHNMLASYYIRRNNFDSALKTLSLSQGLDRDYYSTYFLLGLCYAGKGQVSQARNSFGRALQLNPSDGLSRKYLEGLDEE